MNGNKVLTNLIWRFSERFLAKGISLVVQIILARLLSPDVFGTVAIVMTITTVLQVFVESGFGTALIQKKDADDLDFSSVFYFNITVCAVLYLLLFLLAPLISKAYHLPELTKVIRVLGTIILISGVKNVQQAFVSRNMMFKRFFFATLGGTVGAAVIGIWMALKGWGVWAYVTQYLFNNLVDTIILWITVRWRPKAVFSFSRLKTLFSYGWKLFASSLINVIFERLRTFIIPLRYSTGDLAFYDKGNTFPNFLVENVNSSIDSVLLPALSREQDSAENVRNMTRRAIKVSSYIMWPLMVGLAACARPLISIIYTDKWLPAVPFIRIFCLYYVFWPIHTANLNAIKAVGRSDIFLKLEIAKKVLDLSVLAATLFLGVRAMAIGILLEGIVNLAINAWPNSKLIGYRFSDQIRDIAPPAIMAVAMGIAVYSVQFLSLPDIPVLIIQILLGAGIYLAGSVIFKYESFSYILDTVKKIRRKI